MAQKNPGITILISMGTSMLVLALAFYTLNSIIHSQEQATNIQKSTQLFFASESGAEAAFFHHNARGAGVNFIGENKIAHPVVQAETQWTITGRTELLDSNSFPIFGGLLKENQTVQIPFSWDDSAGPNNPKNTSGGVGGAEISLYFYKSFAQIPDNFGAVKNSLIEKYGNFSIDNNFNFGGLSTGEVLLDWSFSRKNSGKGVETFVPTINDTCGASLVPVRGFICEQQLTSMQEGDMMKIHTGGNPENIVGKILPGGTETNLSNFWDCNDQGSGNTCSDYRLTFRPLLKFSNPDGSKKVRGIPFVLSLESVDTSFPKHFYTVKSDVHQQDFSQEINIEVPERTSIGAFDYVIFD